VGYRPEDVVGAGARVFPDADVPVVQLSIDQNRFIDHHLELGAKLTALLDGGVVVGSGNVVHYLVLGGSDSNRTDEGFDWAERFGEDAKERMLTDPIEVATLDARTGKTAEPATLRGFGSTLGRIPGRR
jgi:aromatic ring-opening dioxygenase catalytic subunit (LigB family)